jgi:quinol monooxygenase YgiN
MRDGAHDSARQANRTTQTHSGFGTEARQWRNAMIYALVTFRVQPSKLTEFESIHRALARFISRQPGCIAIKVHRSLRNPQEYAVYGTWESKEAWESAHQTAEFKAQFKNLPIEQHTLSSGSFFEIAYCYERGEVIPAGVQGG